MVLLRTVEPEAAHDPFNHVPLPNVGSAMDWLLSPAKRESCDTIFILCVVVYVVIILLWLLHSILARCYKGEDGKLYGVCIVVSWGLTSVCMHVLNKAVVEHTKAPASLAVVQMAIAVAIMAPISLWELMQSSPRQLLVWLVVPMVYGGAMCTSTFTYQYMSLSLYTTVRNMAPLVTMPIERLVMDESKAPRFNGMVCLALVTMVVGAVVYVGGINGCSLVGICFAVLNTVLAVLDRFLQRRLLTEECKDLTAKACTLINNAVGMLPSLVVSLLSREYEHARWAQPHDIILIMLSGVAGLGICYLGFECQRLLSVTSFYVMQNMSRVFLIAVGVWLFKDPITSPEPVIGLVLSLFGSFLYGQVQMQSMQVAAKMPQAVEETPEDAKNSLKQ